MIWPRIKPATYLKQGDRQTISRTKKPKEKLAGGLFKILERPTMLTFIGHRNRTPPARTKLSVKTNAQL